MDPLIGESANWWQVALKASLMYATALLALRAEGRQLGWGFQLQSPGFVVVLTSFLFFFALSLAGMFDFGLSLTSAGDSLTHKGGYTGSFFTGVLATVVATPCVGPFMGAAIGFALAQPAPVTFLVFTALALGLAAPYMLLTLNPAWVRLLPKPGAWMDLLKQITALPLFNQMLLGSLNPSLAHVRGVRVHLLEYVFVLLLTILTVACVKIVGSVLVEALLLIPAAAARNLNRSIKGFVWWSIAFSTIACLTGIYAPMRWDLPLPSGGAIILAAALIFVVTLLLRMALPRYREASL